MNGILPFLKTLFSPHSHDRILLVGGTVRDILSGAASRDIDLVTDLSRNELIRFGFHSVEPTSGAVIYFRHHPGFGNIEVTRIDSLDDLENDLRRRDFTINAMALNLSGTHIDPLSGGDDLKKRTLRACSADSFRNDPLRIFRAFRFEADGWLMAPDTGALIPGGNWGDHLRAMPIERFSGEMLKALALKMPENFFARMIEFNVGEEFLPELFRMPHIPAGPLQHHPEGDLFSHSIQVLQRVAATSYDPLTRFCALFHDLGKLATDPALYPKHHGHDYAGFGMAVEFCNRLRLSAGQRTALAWISSLHGKANMWDSLRVATRLTMAQQALKAGIVDILPLVAAADKAGGMPMAGWRDTVRTAGMSALELGIDQEKLEAMPTRNRAAYILQKRVQRLKTQPLSGGTSPFQ